MVNISTTLNFRLIFTLLLVTICLTYISSNYIVTPEKYFELFNQMLTKEQLIKILAFKSRYSWVTYAFNFFIILKIVIVYLIFYIYFSLSSIEINTSLLFRIIIIGEFVFVFQTILRLTFLKVYGFSTFEELQNAYSFSLYSVFQSKQIPAYLIYPLAKLSIYEFLYWIVLCIGIKRETGQTYIQSFKLVLSSYVLALIFFMMLVVLLMLTI